MKQPTQRSDNLPLAIGLMLLAWLMFSMMDTSAKWLAVEGFHPLQTAFCRFFFTLVVILAVFWPREGRQLFRSSRPGIQIARGLALASGSLMNFTAVQFLPLTTTTAIFFVSPLAVCLLSIPILNERVGARRLTAIAVGFLGVLVIVQPFSIAFSWPMLLSLGAMLMASTYFTLSRLVANGDSNETTQIYASLPGTLVLLPLGLWVWQNPATWQGWTVIVMIGVIGAVGHAILTFAHRFAPASTLAPIIYVQAIYMTFCSWVIFAEVPGPWTILGTAIIVASGLYLWMRERQLARLSRAAQT